MHIYMYIYIYIHTCIHVRPNAAWQTSRLQRQLTESQDAVNPSEFLAASDEKMTFMNPGTLVNSCSVGYVPDSSASCCVDCRHDASAHFRTLIKSLLASVLSCVKRNVT